VQPVPIETVAGTEKHIVALVDHYQHGTFALLPEQLGVSVAGTCCDAPVNGTDIVAGLVIAHLLEIDAAPTKI
jgi:hypothetical protein